MRLVPARTTIFKETSWSEDFNEFSTPSRIPWICIAWTIFLEVIFQSVAHHFVCTNASAWVIHTSKPWMYQRGPGIWTKKCGNFLLFPLAYPGKVSLSFVQEKITQLFSSSPGTKPVLDCRVLCPAEQAGWGGCASCMCCAEGCSGTLCHECSTLTFLVNPWLIRSPACSLPRNSGAALEAFIKLLFCRRLSELLWMEICSSLCLHLSCLWGMSTNWSFLWQLQTRRKPRRAQQSFIH